VLTAFSYLVAVRIANRIGLVNTMVYTHIPSSLCLVAIPFVPSLAGVVVLLLMRSALSQMDVPTRSSYVMAIVTPPERPAAASITSVPRSLASAVSPVLAGSMLAATTFGWPLLVAGVVKIAYDLMLLAMFRKVRPPEEQTGGRTREPAQCRIVSGTLPPFSASFCMTAFDSAMFCSALPSAPAWTLKLLRELLARREARVEVEHLEQVDDRRLVVAAAALGGRELGQHVVDVDGRGLRRRRRCGLGLPDGLRRRRGRLRGRRPVPEDLVEDGTEDAHGAFLERWRDGTERSAPSAILRGKSPRRHRTMPMPDVGGRCEPPCAISPAPAPRAAAGCRSPGSSA
jgi:hypothetical protein